eukprot:SAG25_NODE_3135_length_1199_cov_6.149461_1_plen_24_part_10
MGGFRATRQRRNQTTRIRGYRTHR